MFHVKQAFKKLTQQRIDHLLFYVFLFSIPLQLRILINPDTSYIDYVFSYHKAIFFYLSDLLFICFISAYIIFNKLPKLAFWPIILPILWALTYLFHVEHINLALYGVFKAAQFWLIIVFIKQNPSILRPSLLILILSGMLQSVIGIFQFQLQHGLNLRFLGEYIPGLLDSGTATLTTPDGKVLRAYGTMPHPNVFGGYLAIILSIWLYVSRETRDLKQWIIVSCGTFILWWGLLVSFSRSAWLASGLIFAVYISYLIYKKAYKHGLSLLLITIVSCGTLVGFYKDLVFPRSQDISIQSQAVKFRVDFNTQGLNTFKHNKMLGVGPYLYVSQLESDVSQEPWLYQPPHNILIMYLAEYGIIGLIIFLASLFMIGFTWNNQNILCLMFFICICVLGGLDHYLITIQQGVLILAVMLGYCFINKKDVSQPVKHL